MLQPADFPEFVQEVHGRCPFPWQRRLVEQVASERRWPEVIDVPTGLGKTSLLDAAVFLAAVDRELAPRRIFFVVDRRLVVDEAYEHAVKIKSALDRAREGGVVGRVAGQLRQSGDDSVLEVTRMRGGITWDARWVERPDRYAIVTGTVDQVGSRLFFRGYGVTEEARSLDAALVGTDSLIIVDEAHLARPLVQTLDEVRQLGGFDSPVVRRPPRVITMSATARVDGAFGITPADEADPVAGTRLRAAKRMHPVEVRATRTNADTVVPGAVAQLAMALATPGRVVGVVANTVARARAVFELVREQHEAVLLTGRTRPVDRDYLLADYYDRMRAGRAPAPDAPPLLVVATQTIEVGANIDLDGLVTESAPLDALVQRLGRLNRFGQHTEPVPALVVHDSSVDKEDPVYGPSRLETWRWLCGRPETELVRYRRGLDPATLPDGMPASPRALRELLASSPAELLPQSWKPPVLTESVLSAWARTSPAPHPDPPLSAYLHGIVEPRSTIRVIWRAGLMDVDPLRWPDTVERMPPAAEEGIELALASVRRWLDAGAPDRRLSDQDTEPTEPVDGEGGVTTQLTRVRDEDGYPRVLRLRGREGTWLARSTELAPHDVIVVPAEYGGLDVFGWDPTSTDPVVDVADLATRRGRPRLRIGPYLRTVVCRYHPELVESSVLAELLIEVERDAGREELGDYRGRLGQLADELRAFRPDDPRPLRGNLELLRDPRPRTTWVPPAQPGLEPSTEHHRWWVMLAARSAAQADEAQADDRSAAGSSVVGKRIGLDAHQRAVAGRADEFACNLRLPEPLRECVRLAGRWHDEGKRDPRFQAMLWGGDRRMADVATELLAKSGMDPDDRAALRRARDLSAYPAGMQHEALSARVAALRPEMAGCPDPDLVIHLVATHHGHGRPLLEPVVDPAPEKVTVGEHALSTEHTVDWDGPARFARLNEKYGRWGLALLETVVRLADIWCSARGEEEA